MVGTSQRTAQAVVVALTPEGVSGLGGRLADFARDTARLETIGAQLHRDIERYEQARTATWVSLRDELRSITSEATRRQLTHVQDEANTESAARLQTARLSATRRSKYSRSTVRGATKLGLDVALKVLPEAFAHDAESPRVRTLGRHLAT